MIVRCRSSDSRSSRGPPSRNPPKERIQFYAFVLIFFLSIEPQVVDSVAAGRTPLTAKSPYAASSGVVGLVHGQSKLLALPTYRVELVRIADSDPHYSQVPEEIRASATVFYPGSQLMRRPTPGRAVYTSIAITGCHRDRAQYVSPHGGEASDHLA